MSVFGVILACIFPHSDCIRENTEQNNSIYGHFAQWMLLKVTKTTLTVHKHTQYIPEFKSHCFEKWFCVYMYVLSIIISILSIIRNRNNIHNDIHIVQIQVLLHREKPLNLAKPQLQRISFQKMVPLEVSRNQISIIQA